MTLKIKRVAENAVLPVKATKGSAGYDLTVSSVTIEYSEDGVAVINYNSGIAVEIEEGHVGLLLPRSSIYRKSLTLTNCVGIIDSDYRGPVMAKFKLNTNTAPSVYREGERFAQLVIMPITDAKIEEVESLSETERGEGGYGSTNKEPEQNTNNENE